MINVDMASVASVKRSACYPNGIWKNIIIFENIKGFFICAPPRLIKNDLIFIFALGYCFANAYECKI